MNHGETTCCKVLSICIIFQIFVCHLRNGVETKFATVHLQPGYLPSWKPAETKYCKHVSRAKYFKRWFLLGNSEMQGDNFWYKPAKRLSTCIKLISGHDTSRPFQKHHRGIFPHTFSSFLYFECYNLSLLRNNKPKRQKMQEMCQVSQNRTG